MADGDLITKNYQYEFSGLLMGKGTEYITKQWEGLYDLPEIRSNDVERQDDHGVWPGIDLMGPKIINGEIEIQSVLESAGDWESLARNLRNAFRSSQIEIPFVFQRPNQGGKQFIMARCRRRNIPMDWRAARGGTPASVMLVASDPRWYRLQEESQEVTIGPGATSNTLTIDQIGNAISNPYLTIQGPSYNPRILNQDDDNRSLKLDINLPFGSTMTVDLKRRIVKVNGVDRFDVVRADSDWFVLQDGINHLTYSRTNSDLASKLNIFWRAAYI